MAGLEPDLRNVRAFLALWTLWWTLMLFPTVVVRYPMPLPEAAAAT